jgi:hypothetical protein
MNSLNNGMVVVPILTPYGTQLVPMSVNQLLGSGMGAQMTGTDMNSLTQLSSSSRPPIFEIFKRFNLNFALSKQTRIRS